LALMVAAGIDKVLVLAFHHGAAAVDPGLLFVKRLAFRAETDVESDFAQPLGIRRRALVDARPVGSVAEFNRVAALGDRDRFVEGAVNQRTRLRAGAGDHVAVGVVREAAALGRAHGVRTRAAGVIGIGIVYVVLVEEIAQAVVIERLAD